MKRVKKSVLLVKLMFKKKISLIYRTQTDYSTLKTFSECLFKKFT